MHKTSRKIGNYYLSYHLKLTVDEGDRILICKCVRKYNKKNKSVMIKTITLREKNKYKMRAGFSLFIAKYTTKYYI